MQQHLDELCERAAGRRQPLFSRFLNLNEQKEAEIAARKAQAEYLLFGGAADCERRMLGAGQEAPEPGDFPIACLKITRRSAHYGESLEHRAVLGTVMGTGIERELVGDIVIVDDAAYVFCVNTMADMLCAALTRVGRTDTDCEIAEPPAAALRKLTPVKIQAASPRVDAVAAHLYKLSRGDMLELIRQGKVQVDDAPVTKPDQLLKPGQVLSVRGYGRSRYEGEVGVSKKGKLYLELSVYS